MNATAPPTCSCCSPRLRAGGTLRSRTGAPPSIMPISSKTYPIRTCAKKIVLVQDNLNTHAKASLYEAFPPAEAQRLAGRFDWHHTPKHGSWLNMAESELGVLASQFLDRPIPDKETLSRQVASWQHRRNKNQTNADWRFTTADARAKLKRLYPRF